MSLWEIITRIEAGDGHDAWEDLQVWYRRFLRFYPKYPKFFGGRREKWWDAIHESDFVREIRREIIYEEKK